MGTRVTRATGPVSAAEIQQRMQSETSPWRRRYWHLIWLAVVAPRPAQEIAREAGVSTATVHRVLACYRRGGVAAIAGIRKGGRRHAYLPLAEEAAFLAPFEQRTSRGERVRVEEIQQAFHARLAHPVHRVTVERLLARHGWCWRETAGRAAAAAAGETTGGSAERRSAPVAERQRRSAAAGQSRALPRYPSDLSDQEWAILEPLLPPAKPDGRPRTTDLREVLNALLYLDRTGAQWRALPTDFPPWPTVWTYFRQWRDDGTWQRLHTMLREQVRVQDGREPTPSAAIIDSQSVKTSQKGGGAATTAPRRSRGASATSWSIPMAGSCSRW
jgi:putative transposase